MLGAREHKEFDITCPNGPDIGEKSAQAYQIKGVPETFFVDKTGQLRGMHVGPLSPPLWTTKCPECGRVVRLDDLFCAGCGARLAMAVASIGKVFVINEATLRGERWPDRR